MKLDYINTLSPDSEFAITDTKELNAQNLLALFLYTSSVMDNLLDATETVKDFFSITQKVLGAKYTKTLQHDIEYLPCEVCNCFIEFLKSSPNIEVRIK